MKNKHKDNTTQTYIAVLLAGQLRHWETTSKIFKLYNEIYPDVQYDFFLSTWDDSYMGTDSIKANFSFLNAYEVIGTSVLGHHEEDYVRYPYLLKRVNQLKNDYQNEHDIKYDCVISTRPDILLNLETLHAVNNIITSDGISENMIYINDGMGFKVPNRPSKKYKLTPRRFHTMLDCIVFGHENAINVHSNLYVDMYVKKLQINHGVHITPAEHIINNKLNTKPFNGFAKPVRYNMVDFIEDLYETGELKELFNNKGAPKFKAFEEFKVRYDDKVSTYDINHYKTYW